MSKKVQIKQQTVQQNQNQDELLLQNSTINNKNKDIQNANGGSSSEEQIDTHYYEKENQKIQSDQKDLQSLKIQIDKIKKLKSQKNQLSQVNSDLRSQNQNLKIEKKSVDFQRRSLNKEKQKMEGLNSQQNRDFTQTQKRHLSNGKMRASQLNSNENQFQSNYYMKYSSMRENEQNQERFLSPQITKKPIRKNNINLEIGLNSSNQKSYLDDPRILLHKFHLENKKTVIGSFVDELKQELDHSENILQKQKRSHRQTKSKLDETLLEVNHLRQKMHRTGEYDSIVRSNEQLKFQLELQIQQRLLAQEKIRQKQLVLSKYQQVFLRGCRQYEQELLKMDEIYLKTQKVLGIL